MKGIRLLALVICFNLCSCYGFKGISIPPGIDTFLVDDFQLNFSSGSVFPANLELTFAENLRNRIRSESSLKYSEADPDIIFSGTILTYLTSPAAPVEGAETTLNRLDIQVQIVYEDVHDEENNWTKTFSGFQDFPSTQLLSSVEDNLISVIFDEMTERIFNDSFTNW